MRRATSGIAWTLVLLLLIPATPASAEVIDRSCSESGDFCTGVTESREGVIRFEIVAFADYFGRSEACVTKRTTVCHRRSPREHDGLFVWRIRWQGNYPREGAGRYAVRWFDEGGGRIGPALHFRRG